MIKDKEKILDTWTKSVERYELRKKELCQKYKVELEPVEAEEYYTVFKFENGVEFTVPFDENFGDYDLTGDALKFAEKYVEIIENCFDEVDEILEKDGFSKIDTDEYFSSWEKGEREYTVNHYAKEVKDIIVSKIK